MVFRSLTGKESNTYESHNNRKQADKGWAEDEKEEKDEYKQYGRWSIQFRELSQMDRS